MSAGTGWRSRARPVFPMVVAGLSIAGLSACAGSGHQAAVAAPDTRAYPVVEEGQAGSILQAVDATRVRGLALAGSDPAGMASDPRIVGPFRQLSAAQARTDAQQKKKTAAPSAIKRVALLVPADQGWPRFFVAVGDTRDQSTYLLQVLTTPNARSPYGLWAEPVMLPGATLPAVAPPSAGASVLSPDAPGFVLTPREVLGHYADYLNQSTRSTDAKNFRRSTFSDQLGDTLTKDTKDLKAVATVTSKHSVAAGNPFALRTRDGGALVIGALTQDYTITVKKGQGVKITDDALAALAGGKNTVKKSFTRTAMEVLVFRVPPAGTSPITLIAAQRGAIGTKSN